jgi:hypothetical protein
MLFRDDAVFMKNLEKIPISLRLAPTMKRYEMIPDVDDLLNAQLEVAFDEGPRPQVPSYFFHVISSAFRSTPSIREVGTAFAKGFPYPP